MAQHRGDARARGAKHGHGNGAAVKLTAGVFGPTVRVSGSRFDDGAAGGIFGGSQTLSSGFIHYRRAGCEWAWESALVPAVHQKNEEGDKGNEACEDYRLKQGNRKQSVLDRDRVSPCS